MYRGQLNPTTPLGSFPSMLCFPVVRVNYVVEDAGVGQVTDYDRLVLDVWTWDHRSG